MAALFADAQVDPRLDTAASVMQQSIRAAMRAPLEPHDQVLGVLYVDNVSIANRFTQEDLEFLTAFARGVSATTPGVSTRSQPTGLPMGTLRTWTGRRGR